MGWSLQGLLDPLTPWRWRLRRIGQVSEMALVHADLVCKVQACRVLDCQRKPTLLLLVHTPVALAAPLIEDLRCYLTRKLNAVLGTRLGLDQVLVVLLTAGLPPRKLASDVPVVTSEALARKLALLRPMPAPTGGVGAIAAVVAPVHPTSTAPARSKADLHREFDAHPMAGLEVREFSATDIGRGFDLTVPAGDGPHTVH